jgi:hypothetical protein
MRAGTGRPAYPKRATASGRVAESDDGKTVGGQEGKQFRSAGLGRYAIFIVNFHLLNHDILFFSIQVGSRSSDCLNTAASVGVCDDAEGIEMVSESPGTPHAFHRRDGVDKDSVHIKENGLG